MRYYSSIELATLTKAALVELPEEPFKSLLAFGYGGPSQK
jgi:hypothetical protein